MREGNGRGRAPWRRISSAASPRRGPRRSASICFSSSPTARPRARTASSQERSRAAGASWASRGSSSATAASRLRRKRVRCGSPGKASPALFRDKLVLIGVSGLGLLDFQATPLGERIPGVEVHAQILEQIFDGAYLRRPSGASWTEAALLALAGLLLVVVVPAARVWVSGALLAALLLAFAAGGVLAFKSGMLLNVAAPALGVVLVFSALLTATFAGAGRHRRLLRQAQARMTRGPQAAAPIQMWSVPGA